MNSLRRFAASVLVLIAFVAAMAALSTFFTAALGCARAHLPPPSNFLERLFHGGGWSADGPGFQVVLNILAALCCAGAVVTLVAGCFPVVRAVLPPKLTLTFLACAVAAWNLNYFLVHYLWLVVLLEVAALVLLVTVWVMAHWNAVVGAAERVARADFNHDGRIGPGDAGGAHAHGVRSQTRMGPGVKP